MSVATNASGVVVSNQHFDPWGKVRTGGVGATRRGFTGQYLDESGVMYYNARYYDPGLGRFISPDTIAPHRDNPQSRNRYSSVLNNPLRYTDPTGHCAEGDTDDPKACQQAQADLEAYGFTLVYLHGWMLDELEAMITASTAWLTASGWSIDRFRDVFGGTSLIRGGANAQYAGFAMHQLGSSTIRMYDSAFARDAAGKLQNLNGTLNVFVHELAHIWDFRAGGAPSATFVEDTGGAKQCVLIFCSYDPGDEANMPKTSAYYKQSRHEDFAESVAATVLHDGLGITDGVMPSYVGSSRDTSIRNVLKGSR